MIWLHVSELSIDRLLAGELRRDDADAMRDHARACKACGDRLADAEATQREFTKLATPLAPRLPIVRPQPGFAQPGIAPRRWTFVLVGSAAVALAAAFALVVAWPGAGHGNQQHRVQVAQASDRTNGDRTSGGAMAGDRTKGRAIVGFFIAHDGDMRRGGAKEVVTPGDRLQIYTTTSTPHWLAIISTDERGARSVYVEPRVIEPGTERLLPLSLELDDALGSETVTAIFCAEHFDPLTVDLTRCTSDRFTLDKVAR